MSKKKQRKKKKKQRQIALLKQKKVESQKFIELLEVLEELEKEEKYVDVQICPHCKSPRVRSMNGDMSGHMGLLPEKFECLDCGWRERLVIKATNRKLGVKDVAIMPKPLTSKKKNNISKCEKCGKIIVEPKRTN